MHYVGHIDWDFVDRPGATTATSSGLARQVVVGRDQGAVHTDLAVGALASGGWIARHVHAFEEALYVLAGELLLELDGHVHRLVAGDYAFMPLGVHHTLANDGDGPVRWLSLNTPQRLDPGASRRDTFYASQPARRRGARGCGHPPAVRRPDPSMGRPLRRHAATARGDGRQGRRVAVGRRPGWTRRSSPTAGSA